MTLLAPGIVLVGAAAAAVAVYAHLRGRRRPMVVPFAAVRFLPRPAPVAVRKRRIEDPWLLLLRALAVSMIALAAARPSRPTTTGLAVLSTPHDAVLLLDDSASMDARVAGDRLRRHAARRARAILDALPPGSRAGLSFVDPVRKPVALSADLAAIRAQVDAWARDPGRPVARRLSEALDVAAALAPEAQDRPFVVYPVSDWTAMGLGSLADRHPAFPILPVPVPEAPAVPVQAWIQAVTWKPDPTLDRGALQIEVVVGRTAAAPDTAEVTFSVDGDVLARATARFDGDRARVRFTHVLADPSEPAAAAFAVEVPGDVLAADDVHHVYLRTKAGLQVLVGNGAPSDLRAHDEVHYLTTALSVAGGEPTLSAVVRTADGLERAIREDPTILDGYDVLILANAPAPAQDVADVLERAVSNGMGLWITAGDHVDPVAYGARLRALLPLAMRDTKAAGTLPGRTKAVAERLTPPDRHHPVFARGPSGPLLTQASAHRILLFEPSNGPEVEVPLSFESGAPALLLGTHGRGRVAVLATTIDRDWTDLPLQPGFVSLVEGVVRYLAEGRTAPGAHRIPAGTPRSIPGAGPFSVTRPDGTSKLVAAAGARSAVFADTWQLGPYTARDTDERIVDRFTVVLDPAESDLSPTDPPATTPSDDGRMQEVTRWAPLWRHAARTALLLLLAEALLRLARAAVGRGLRARRRGPGSHRRR